MAESFHLEMVAADRRLVDEAAESLQAPARDGSIGILPGHAPLLTALGTGPLSFVAGGKRQYLAVREGVMEVLPDRVRVLASSADWASEIDVERERVELDRALEALSRRETENHLDEAQAAVAHARARLEAWEQSRQ